ncbi:coiled-coil domain-containing protein [Wolbachia pipientis]
MLDVIESCSSFQETIKQLEEKILIWYFIGPLRKDEDITGQINLKWEKEFQKFEQSINETHREFEASLPNQNFLAYSTKDDDFKIRFENEEKPIEISNILRTSSEGKVYNISLGKDSQINASKKNGNERHYDFTGSSSCEMTINWQAKDSEGNSIDCSMTVKLDSGGIQSVIGEPKFGGITSSEEVLKLVGQNKEVFINRKTLYQAFTDIGQDMDSLEPTQDLSSQLPTPSSSGYSSPSTPSSRRSSSSVESEIGDEESEITDEYINDDYDEQEIHKDYKKKYEQEGLKGVDEAINEINKLAEQRDNLSLERDSLRDKVNEQQRVIFERDQRIKEQDASIKSLIEKLEKLEELNKKIEKEGDTQISELSEEKQTGEEEAERLKAELKRMTQELAWKNQNIEQLTQKIEKELQDKNDVIESLNDKLKDKEDEVQSVNGINKELQKKLKQSEANLTVLEKKSANLENDLKKIVEGLKDDHKKQLAEQLMETKKKNNTLAETASQLSKELNELQREKEDLEREIRQLEPGRSLADELSEENTKREIEKLQYQLKEKEGMLTCTQEELASVKESLEQLQNILQQEKGQATQTEVEYESRGTSMQQQDQGIQAVNNNSSRIARGLRQENKKLTRDKLTISEQLKQKIREIDELKKNLKQLQEENKQLKQEVTKNAGVDASSSTGQKEAKEAEVIPQNIMDWPVPIPDDKPEEQKTPSEPIKVNTELSDPKSISAEGPEKSPPLSK